MFHSLLPLIRPRYDSPEENILLRVLWLQELGELRPEESLIRVEVIS